MALTLIASGQEETWRRQQWFKPQLDEITETGVPKLFTADEAKMFGVDLSASGVGDDWADWLVKVSPDEASENGFSLSYLSPEKYEYFPDLSVADPTGKMYTAEEWSAYVNPVPTEDITGALGRTFGTVNPQAQGRSDILAAGEAMQAGLMSVDEFNAVAAQTNLEDTGTYLNEPHFAGMDSTQAIQALDEWARTDPEEFLGVMRQKGRTPDTENIIRQLYPTATEDDVTTIFGGIPSTGLSMGEMDFKGQKAQVTVMPDYSVWAATGDKNKQIGTWDDKNQVLLPMPDSRGSWEKFTGSIESGMGSWFDQLSGVADWFHGITTSGLDFNIDALDQRTPQEKRFSEGYARAEEAIWQKETQPTEEIAARLHEARVQNGGLWWVGLETLVGQLPLMTVSLLALPTGAPEAAAAAGGVGVVGRLGAFGKTFLSAIPKGMTAAATSRITESLIEGGGAYQEAIAMGMDKPQAVDMANRVFAQNVAGLSISDMAQFGAMAMAPEWNLARLSELGLARVVVGTGGNLVFQGLTEGGEEYYQEIIKRQVLGEDISLWAVSHNLSDDDIRQVTILGAMMGVALGGAQDAVTTMSLIYDAVRLNLAPDAQTQYDQIVKKKGQQAALDWAAKQSPDVVKAIVNNAMIESQRSQTTADTETEAASLDAAYDSQLVPGVKGIARGYVMLKGILGSEKGGVTLPGGEEVRTPVHEFAQPKAEPISAETAEMQMEAEQAPPLPEPSMTRQEKMTAIRTKYKDMVTAAKEKGADRLVRQKYKAERTLSKIRALGEGKLAKVEQESQLKAQRLKRDAEVALARQQTKLQTKAEQIASIKSDLRAYIEEHLPMSERGHMLAAVEGITSETELGVQLARVEALAETTAAKEAREKVDNLINRTKVEGLPEGKYPTRQTADAQSRLDYIRSKLHGSRQEAVSSMIANAHSYERGELSHEELVRLNTDLSFQGIDGMTSDELRYVHDELTRLIKSGHSQRQAEVAKIRERQQGLEEMALDVMTGGKGNKVTPASIPKESDLTGKPKKIASEILRGQLNWQNALDSLSKLDKRSKQYASRLFKWGVETVSSGFNEERAGLEKARSDILHAQADIFGTTKKRELDRLAWERQNKKENLGDFKDGNGNRVTLEMTPNQIAKKYQEALDPTLETTFKKMGWTYEMLTALNHYMDAHPKLKAWADWQMQYMQENHARIDAVVSKVYGVHLPQNPYYSHIERDYTGHEDLAPTPGDMEHLQLIEESYRYATEKSGALESRTKNTLPLKFTDADKVFNRHVAEMEHFIAWSERISDLRAVFQSKPVKEAIRQYHEPGMVKWLQDIINDYARGGMDKANTVQWIEMARTNFAVAALSRVSVLVKQPSSLPSYATRMPLSDFVAGLADFATDPVGHWKEMYQNSEYLRERYGEGTIDRDLRLLYEQIKTGQQKPGPVTSVLGVRNWLINSINYMDAVSNSAGMWAAYRGYLQRHPGDTTGAIAEMEAVTEATQSTSRLSSLTSWQRGGTFWRLATMFQNNEVKYYNIIADNIRNMRYGRVDSKTFVKNIAIAWVVLPVLFQLMSDAFRPKKEHLIEAAVLGPLGNMLVIGGFSEALADVFVGHQPMYETSPLLQVPNDILNVVQKAVKLAKDDDITTDDIITFCEQFGKTAGAVTGLPTPYAVQAIEAIRSKNWPELIFSRYALYEGGESPADRQKRAQAANALSKSLGDTDEAGDTFTMSTLRGKLSDKLGNVDPTKVTEKAGYSPLVVSYSEMRTAQAEMDLLPGRALYEINADPLRGETYEDYYNQWQARLLITDPKELAEYDKIWGNSSLGNLTNRQMDLLKQYGALDTNEEREAFREDNPEITVNPQKEWLKAHVEENANLALWGLEKPLTRESYDKALQMASDFDIVPSAMWSQMPPENLAGTYFEYQEGAELYGANSAECKLARLENSEFEAWGEKTYGWQPVEGHLESLKLAVQYREQDEEYASFADDYGLTYKERVALSDQRKQYLLDNPEYHQSRLLRDAYGLKVPDALIDDYVEYYTNVQTNKKFSGKVRTNWLRRHPAFYEEVGLDLLGWKPITTTKKGGTGLHLG